MTFDDTESVIEPLETEELNPKVKPRSRTALEVYDEIQARKLEETDIFDE